MGTSTLPCVAAIFDELIVAVYARPLENRLFSTDERVNNAAREGNCQYSERQG